MHRPSSSRSLRVPVGSLFLLVCASFVGPAPLVAEEALEATVPGIREADLRRHLGWLASEELRGRETATAGARLAGDYVAAAMERVGLRPAGVDGYFQPFPLTRPTLGEGNRLAVASRRGNFTLPVEEAFNPFSVSPTKKAKGSLVFAGYGITAPDRVWTDAEGTMHTGWDDYAGLDVKGRIVLVLRKDPGWNAVRHAAFLAKLSNAVEHGAAGLLLVNDSTSIRGGRDVIGHWSAPIGAPAGSATIPFAFVRRVEAERMLAAGGLEASLAQLEQALRASGPRSRALPDVAVTLRTALGREEHATARNVLGLLPGTDPSVAEEVVVVGAHYDHIGLGRFGSLGGASAAGLVHPGADDNASGTSALLELFERFAASPPRRPLLFAAFSGEEMGLLGSRHYVENPTVPLEQVVCMVNLDMVGRSDDAKLRVGGVGTGRGLRAIVEAANAPYAFHVTYDAQGAAPTDSMSFFRKRIPVLFFFTGVHEDYHRPSDTVDRIRFEGLERLTRLVADVVADLADRDVRLAYTDPPALPRPPLLGIRMSPEGDERGIAIAGVQPGGPADRAGVRAGDVLVALATQVVRSPQDLRSVLVRLKAGRPVEVVVLRDGETLRLEIVPAARGRR